MAKKRSSTNKIDMKVILDTLISSLIVQKLPILLNNLVFSGQNFSEMTLKLIGAGAAYFAGGLLKRPNVTNIGIGLALSDFAGGLVDQFLGTSTTVNLPGGTQPAGNLGGFERLRISEYVDGLQAMESMPASEYENYY